LNLTDEETKETTPVCELDLDSGDPAFRDRVIRKHGGENLMKCYACGACSAVCPVQSRNQRFDPRRFIRLAVLGMKKELIEDPLIWECSTCYTCLETCPQKVGFTEVLFAVKNIAAEEGCYPAGLGVQPDLLRDHGRLYEITDFENEKRAELGLPPLPENPGDFKKILVEFKLGHKEED
jgi:heterodisulfide reductase subunit C